MRRLLLPLVLAVVVAACKSDTGPTPVDSLQAPFWQGKVKYSRHSVTQELDETVTLEGPVTWIKDPDPELTPLVKGTATYIILSGSLTVTHAGRIGPCTLQGGTTHLLKPGDGYLLLSPDGTYTGSIHSEATFPTTVSCPPGNSGTLRDDVAAIDIEMRGQVANLRMQGAMAPITVSVSTFTGSWDFFYALTGG